MARGLPGRYRVKDVAGLYFSSMDAGLSRHDFYRFMSFYRMKSCVHAPRGCAFLANRWRMPRANFISKSTIMKLRSFNFDLNKTTFPGKFRAGQCRGECGKEFGEAAEFELRPGRTLEATAYRPQSRILLEISYDAVNTRLQIQPTALGSGTLQKSSATFGAAIHLIAKSGPTRGCMRSFLPRVF